MIVSQIPNEVYARPDGVELLLDVHRPAGDDTWPAVLYVHGGWGRGGRTTDVTRRVLPLAAAGFVVASLDYRHLPHHLDPSPVDDVVAAAGYLRSEARRFGLDPDAIGVWGSSAGASLATLAALRTPGLFQAVVHYCGPTDFFSSSVQGLGGRSRLDQTRSASSLAYVAACAPPSLIVHGDRDRIASVNDARALHSALSRTGNESFLLIVAGAGHDDPRFDGKLVRTTTTQFLSATLATGGRGAFDSGSSTRVLAGQTARIA
jgi:acetyl esterase/lipase